MCEVTRRQNCFVNSEIDVDGELVEEDPPWDPWSPGEVVSRLARSNARWYVVAGWAIDLFRGGQSRPHHDIEIGVARDDFPLIATSLSEFDFDVIGSGRRWPHSSDAFRDHFQTWVRDRATGVYHLDVFREPHEGDMWFCRRDARIRMPYNELICVSDSGIPYMSPEVVLLFKAKHQREKDRFDFEGTLALLDPRQIDWLRTSLELVHPGHPWISKLRD
jgi:hypothetical protein